MRERWAEAVNRESNRANQAKQALMKVHPELSAITYLSSVKPDSPQRPEVGADPVFDGRDGRART